MHIPLLSLMLAIPAGGFAFLLLTPKNAGRIHQTTALILSFVVMALSLVLLRSFSINADFQFVEHYALLPKWGIWYYLGVDGISIFLVLLAAILSPIVVLCSYKYITKTSREYYALLLLLECAIIGALVALDAVVFYIFWELMLIPMFFIIGIWGGPRRIYATIKFVIFTLSGSLLMLIALIYLIGKTSAGHAPNCSIPDLSTIHLSIREQCWLFAAFAFGFAIKVPLFPLHTWLPDAHVEAPTGGSVVLAGVLLKMGVYGFLRLAFPLFPDAIRLFAPLFTALGVIAVIYGALVAFVQDDAKKLVAYSSVSHMGLVVLGLFVFSIEGTQGSIYQMLSHGISTGALFLIVGMLYERRHTRLFSELGGIAKSAPLMAVALLLTVLSSVGLPGLNGFIGEFLLLLATFKSSVLLGSLAAGGVVLSAVYLFRFYQKIMFGPITIPENASLPDLSRREGIILLPLIVLFVVMGFFPGPILQRTQPAVEKLIEQTRRTAVCNTQDTTTGQSYSFGAHHD
jgi:NADH-quinone oxidoreductase subunit M